jgi:hypothetical protein
MQAGFGQASSAKQLDESNLIIFFNLALNRWIYTFDQIGKTLAATRDATTITHC